MDNKQEIQVGDGATIYYWSDRVAATIINISKSGKVVTVQTDKVTRVDNNGMSEAQEYRTERNSNGAIYKFSLRKNDRWVKVGESLRGTGLAIGVRRPYYDFSF